jgi:hypothetical protein
VTLSAFRLCQFNLSFCLAVQTTARGLSGLGLNGLPSPGDGLGLGWSRSLAKVAPTYTRLKPLISSMQHTQACIEPVRTGRVSIQPSTSAVHEPKIPELFLGLQAVLKSEQFIPNLLPRCEPGYAHYGDSTRKSSRRCTRNPPQLPPTRELPGLPLQQARV